jgi:hypothetical protein
LTLGIGAPSKFHMRPQDWAFFGATGLALFTVTATVQGWVVGALAGLALTATWGGHLTP